MPCLIIKVSDETNRLNIRINRVCNLETPPIIHGVGESLNITTEKKNPILNIRCSILCSVGAVDDGYEVFEAADGIFMLHDGESFNVIKEDGV